MVIIDFFNELIKYIFNNPVIIFLIILLILMNIFYPKFRGFMGEFWIKLELSKLSKKEYLVLNNIMIEDDLGTHQIDHIIISKYGIFVIESKNYYGMIIGDEYKDKWIQYLGKNKYYFKNPIHQNYGHIKALEKLLNIGNDNFISIICFSNQTKLKVSDENRTIQLDYLIKTIKSYRTIKLDTDIDVVLNKIKSLNITDNQKRKKHIKDIKEKIRENNTKSNNMICPKCGNNLIVKNGKYGKFIGCSNYPKCKYTNSK